MKTIRAMIKESETRGQRKKLSESRVMEVMEGRSWQDDVALDRWSKSVSSKAPEPGKKALLVSLDRSGLSTLFEARPTTREVTVISHDGNGWSTVADRGTRTRARTGMLVSRKSDAEGRIDSCKRFLSEEWVSGFSVDISMLDDSVAQVLNGLGRVVKAEGADLTMHMPNHDTGVITIFKDYMSPEGSDSLKVIIRGSYASSTESVTWTLQTANNAPTQINQEDIAAAIASILADPNDTDLIRTVSESAQQSSKETRKIVKYFIDLVANNVAHFHKDDGIRAVKEFSDDTTAIIVIRKDGAEAATAKLEIANGIITVGVTGLEDRYPNPIKGKISEWSPPMMAFKDDSIRAKFTKHLRQKLNAIQKMKRKKR